MTSRETISTNENLQTPNFDALPLREWPEQWHPIDDFQTPQSVGDDDFNRIVNDGLSFDRDPSFFTWGNPDLPIGPYRNEFLDKYRNCQVLVTEGEPGSGKTTEQPLFILEEMIRTGSPGRLFVTSPRITPTRESQAWLRKSVGPDYAHLIGRLTGTEKDSDCHPDARVIFITEQRLLKLAARGKLHSDDSIMFDEVHERTKPMVVAMGLLIPTLKHNPDRRIIISSATFDTYKQARYAADPATGKPAPILSIPGRNFPVEFRMSDKSVGEEARELIKDGKNVIVFEPGISRMHDTAAKMSFIRRDDGSRKTDTVVHLLYGDQSPREQKESLNPSDGHSIVANKVGETSLTPDGKDAAVSSGLSNVGGYRKGIRILETVHASKAALKQQGGRVGRTKGRIHVLATPDNASPIAYDDRPEYDRSEIQNGSVASQVAELLNIGIRLEDLELIDYPTEENLRHDYKLLRRLGATALVDGVEILTDIGKQMIDLNVDMPLARVVVEARHTDNTENMLAERVRAQACAIAAIQQVNGILDAWNNGKRRDQLVQKMKGGLSKETKSDPLFELDAFVAMRKMELQFQASGLDDADARFERLLRQKDVKVNPYYKAFRTFEELCRREQINPNTLTKPTDQERTRLVECLITGAEELFVQKSMLWHQDIRGSSSRQLGMRSTIDPRHAGLIIGTAFNLRGMTDRGTFGREYISASTAVTTEQLLMHAAHRITRKTIGYELGPENAIQERQAVYFDDSLLFDVVPGELSPTLATREFMIRSMMFGMSLPRAHAHNKGHKPKQVHLDNTPNAAAAIKNWREAQDLAHRTRRKLEVDHGYRSLVNKIIRESVEKLPLDVTDPIELDALIPRVSPYSLVRPSRQKKIREIIDSAPDSIELVIGDSVEDLDVTYKNGIAIVLIPNHLKYKIKREDFAALEATHDVKVKVSGGQPKNIGPAFEQLAERYQAYLKRKERREALGQDISPAGPTTGSSKRKNNQASDVDPEARKRTPWLKKRPRRSKAQDDARQKRSDRRQERARMKQHIKESVLVD